MLDHTYYIIIACALVSPGLNLIENSYLWKLMATRNKSCIKGLWNLYGHSHLNPYREFYSSPIFPKPIFNIHCLKMVFLQG